MDTQIPGIIVAIFFILFWAFFFLFLVIKSKEWKTERMIDAMERKLESEIMKLRFEKRRD